ncbi:Serine/threonine-protein phosphatase 7 long form-like protein [Hirschfeldia incana]|nr:Serine/threonine-protein phosphatase 7 long form-like protein [Hirschfeldia incana]
MCLNGKRFEGLRTARFLKHTTMSIDDDVFDLPLDAFICRPPESVDPTAKISFPGWASPSPNWVEWVDAMAETHASSWRKAGVYDAILASRYEIKKQDELMMALVEKWCVETNTFVFPWGEATLSLEDMVVLGGFSVIGNNAMAPVKREEMKEVEEKMRKVKREIEGEFGKKCSVGLWMKEMMMKSRDEIEHEGFLVTWLSRFVFPGSGDLVNDMLFPAAVQLARGVTLALAPAVLAGIFRDLGLLKEHLAGYGERETVVVKSPLQFVQVWAYERIMELQPPGQPGQLSLGEPRMARWHQHGGGQDLYGYPENVRAVLDSTNRESFDFRPYTKPVSNFKFPRFYMEDNCWVHLHSDDKNIVALGRCLRFCKLVGVNCIEPYYPHRVALQFGYDLDVPGVVSARNETPELAWKDYIRPIDGDMMYIPSRVSVGDVTVRYIRWWKLSFAMLQSEAKKLSHRLLASPPRQKPSTIVASRETKAKKGSLGRSSSSGSLIGSEKSDKQHPLKKPEWVQRSPPGWKKSPDRSSSSSALGGGGAKDLKGVLRGLGRTKGQGHVTFQLPVPSPKSSPPSKTNTPLEKQNDSHVKKPRMVPRVADLAKRPSSSSHVPRNTSFVPLPHRRMNYNDSSSRRVSKEPYKAPSLSGYPPSKRKKSPRSVDIVNSPGQRSSLSPQQGSKESPKSPSVSGSSSLTRKNLPRSQELNKSSSSTLGALSVARKKPPRSSEAVSLSGGSSAIKRNTDVSTKQDSPRKAQELKATTTNVKFLEEIVTLREHVGEEGEVTYHIPKQQFEDLSQGVQDVLHDLHSIKSALNIQDDE